MRGRSRTPFGVAIALAIATLPVQAQRVGLIDRVERLEQQQAQTANIAQANVELLNRLNALQAEVQSLRAQIEQLQNENAQLKEDARVRYLDLDSRLTRLEQAPEQAVAAPAEPVAANAAPTGAPPATTASTAATGDAAVPAGNTPADPQGELPAYQAGLDALVQRNEPAEAARLFQAFLRDYPQSSLASNAWYWLGESYYVTRNFEYALESFGALLEQYPDSRKAPDALLKQAYCLIALDRREEGERLLNEVIRRYPEHPVAGMAEGRLRGLRLDDH